MIPVCEHLMPNIKAFDTTVMTRPVLGRVADDNAYTLKLWIFDCVRFSGYTLLNLYFK